MQRSPIRALALTALLGGLALPPTAAAQPAPAGAVNGLLVTVSVDKTVWAPGETVAVEARLKNVGHRPLVVDTFGELNTRYADPNTPTKARTIWELYGCSYADGQRAVAKDQFIRLDPGQTVLKTLTCQVPHNLDPGRQHLWLTYGPQRPESVVKETDDSDPQLTYPDLSELPLWDGHARSPGVWVDLVASPGDAPPARSQLDRYYELPELAQDAYHTGDLEKAAHLAEELLRLSRTLPPDWHYGNAVHHGHRILGLVALARGDRERAKQELLASADTPGSPQLNEFGPDPSLAKALLQAGERATVRDFLKRCIRFWNSPKLLQWLALASTGQVPDEW